MKNWRVLLLLFVSAGFAIFTAPVFAEKIILKSGAQMEGKITERTEEYVKMETGGVATNYYVEQIDRIVEDNAPASQAGTGQDGTAVTEEQVRKITEEWEVFMANKNYDGAQDFLMKAKEKNPNIPEIYIGLAITNFYLNDVDKSILALSHALGSGKTSDPDAIFCLGLLYDMAGRKEDAIKQLNKYLSKAQADPLGVFSENITIKDKKRIYLRKI